MIFRSILAILILVMLGSCGGSMDDQVTTHTNALGSESITILSPTDGQEFYVRDRIQIRVELSGINEKVRAFLEDPSGKVRKKAVNRKKQKAQFKIGKKWPTGTYRIIVQTKSGSTEAIQTIEVLAEGEPDDDDGDSGWGGTSCTGTGTSTYGLRTDEQQLFDSINTYRAANNLAPLRVCRSLSQAAQWQANDMRDRGYYAHSRPGGPEFWERACTAGYQHLCGIHTWAGEIITGWATTPHQALSMWQGSAGHDALMRDSGYLVAGIGHACGGNLGHYWVVEFAGTWESSCD
jgi:uncharacterized protein YkwD